MMLQIEASSLDPSEIGVRNVLESLTRLVMQAGVADFTHNTYLSISDPSHARECRQIENKDFKCFRKQKKKDTSVSDYL